MPHRRSEKRYRARGRMLRGGPPGKNRALPAYLDRESIERGGIVSDFERVPVNALLGLHLVRCTLDAATVEMTPRPDVLQEHGVVHGGILALLADTAAVYLTHPFLEEGRRMASIEFKVNFLAPATADRGALRADASLVRRGKRVVVAESRVMQGDTEVLRGLFTYALL